MLGVEDLLTHDPYFCHWLAGFIAGEGHFGIVRYRTYYACRFAIKLRDDDRDILEEICAKTGLGSIRDEANGEGNPQVTWTITKKDECRALVWLLDRVSLRARKHQDYLIWKRAMTSWEKMDYSTMASAHGEIQSVRKYAAQT